jgi:hypothetical protein
VLSSPFSCVCVFLPRSAQTLRFDGGRGRSAQALRFEGDRADWSGGEHRDYDDDRGRSAPGLRLEGGRSAQPLRFDGARADWSSGEQRGSDDERGRPPRPGGRGSDPNQFGSPDYLANEVD